jgi:hypothetical protein
LNLDSLASVYRATSLLVTVYQQDINPRDLTTLIVLPQKHVASMGNLFRPETYFKDFVITAGLLIILLSVFVIRLNPKLASDYFSASRIFSLREVDDAQSSARLTSSANVQFYIITSLLLGFYLIIVLNYLPDAYELPLYLRGNSLWSVLWQWFKLSVIILALFFLKIFFIFLLTRLFNLRGLTRIHFFNWVRLLLIAFGILGTVVFIYFIWRGQREDFYVVFLSFIIATLTVWIFVVFLKLSSKREHSMFHLFSYICATELIPLLFTIKVLFQ